MSYLARSLTKGSPALIKSIRTLTQSPMRGGFLHYEECENTPMRNPCMYDRRSQGASLLSAVGSYVYTLHLCVQA